MDFPMAYRTLGGDGRAGGEAVARPGDAPEVGGSARSRPVTAGGAGYGGNGLQHYHSSPSSLNNERGRPPSGKQLKRVASASATITSSTDGGSFFGTGDSSSARGGASYAHVLYENKAPIPTEDGTTNSMASSSPRMQHPANNSTGDMLALASRTHGNGESAATMRRPKSSESLMQAAAYDRKRGAGGSTAMMGAAAMMRAAKAAPEERTGFARIYFENHTFTSSTVFKLFGSTTVLEVRKSMASKIKIPASEFSNYAIVVVFPTDNRGTLSARTLRDDEIILELMDRLNRARPPAVEADDTIGTVRTKPKHRSRPQVKFVLTDVRGSQLDISGKSGPTSSRRPPSDSQVLSFPVLLGKGVHSGYLHKASVQNPTVWRKRWFIIKGDQLLYCKSSSNQRDVTSISLLNAYLAKARPEVREPFSFELRTPRRIYQLRANSKDEMAIWIHALHVQIGISTENHRLYEAEILITEDAVSRSESETDTGSMVEPSLLERVLSREDTLKLFRDFVYTTPFQSLLDTWIECEMFRRSCIAREIGFMNGVGPRSQRTVEDEWGHLREILRAIRLLNVVHANDLEQLQQAFNAEQNSHRLSMEMGSNEEYPRMELIVPVQRKLFKAIEAGPFKQFLLQNGYSLLLERIIGCIA